MFLPELFNISFDLLFVCFLLPDLVDPVELTFFPFFSPDLLFFLFFLFSEVFQDVFAFLSQEPDIADTPVYLVKVRVFFPFSVITGHLRSG